MSTKRKKTYIKQSFFSGYGITIPLEGDLGFKTVSFRTVFFYNCLKFEVGDSLSGLICQSSHASPCLCTVTNCTIILQEGKITQGRFSPRKTSYNHATIIKTCKQRSNFKRCFYTKRKFTWSLLLATRPAGGSRISDRNSTEPTKQAPDHLLTTPPSLLRALSRVDHSLRT